MELALIEPYEKESGIGAFVSGFYPELESRGAERIQIDTPDFPFLQTTLDINMFLPRKLRSLSSKYDFIFIPSHSLISGFDPKKADSEIAVMVHDLEQYPAKTGNFLSRFNRNRAVEKLKHCDYVLTPSESTRLDILKYTEVDIEKTKVIGEGVEMIDGRQNVDVDDFFLYVGGMQKRKNVDTLIKAFSDADTEKQLVLAGRIYSEENRQKIVDLIEQKGLEKRVRMLGEVSEEELAYLYENTAGYIHPAFFEGFGRPPVEAATYGAPVAVVRGTAPSEFLDEALKMEPDVRGIRTGIEQIGPENSQDIRFEWSKTAEKFTDYIGGLN